MKEELKNKEHLKAEVNKIVNQLKEQNKKSINTTDPDCTRIKSLSGSHALFNAQIVVDEKHRLIARILGLEIGVFFFLKSKFTRHF